MTNFGQPYIVVEDGDYNRGRELYLKHCFEGQELDLGYAEKTLRQVQRIWGRPVHLETVIEEKPVVLSFDGEQSSSRAVDS
jgi:stage V sporulation protein R